MSNAHPFRPFVAAALIFALFQTGRAQTPAPSQPPSQPGTAAARIRTQVADLPVGGRITVNLLDGHEYYGTIRSIEPESFSMHEVDLKTDFTFRYDEIKKVRKDYGRKSITGKRIHPRRALITTLIVVGGLLTLVFVLVASDKS